VNSWGYPDAAVYVEPGDGQQRLVEVDDDLWVDVSRIAVVAADDEHPTTRSLIFVDGVSFAVRGTPSEVLQRIAEKSGWRSL
jgi:hypothetical protein